MKRDPLLDEEILWEGRPGTFETPSSLKMAAAAAFLVAATCTCFALVSALGLGVSAAPLLLCAGWTTSIGFGSLLVYRWWLGKVTYVVTEQHVMWRRGHLSRAIRRDQISYARIFWSAEDPNAGDLELVRAVPAGVLKRRLLIRLRGLAAPDKVWALVRGVQTRSDSNAGQRCISQRLEEDERVLCSSQPVSSWRRYLPSGSRSWRTLAISLTLLLGVGHIMAALCRNLAVLLDAGLADDPVVLAALLLGEASMLTLLVGAAAGMLYAATIRQGRKLSGTYYLVTNRRVLIQRGREELHLDRTNIVDVIDAPTMRGLRDLFLVLDGPQARALEVGGAFGETERDAHLKPILEGLVDAEVISAILLQRPRSAPLDAPDRAA